METFQLVPSLAEIAQLVEHIHGKDEVAGSIPALGSKIKVRSEPNRRYKEKPLIKEWSRLVLSVSAVSELLVFVLCPQ
jgi:hypothetical protein